MAKDSNGNEIIEYPKLLYFGDANKVLVNDAKEEEAAIAEYGPLPEKKQAAKTKASGWKS